MMKLVACDLCPAVSSEQCDLNVWVGLSATNPLPYFVRFILSFPFDPLVHPLQEATSTNSCRSVLEQQPCRSASQSCAEQDCWPSSPGWLLCM